MGFPSTTFLIVSWSVTATLLVGLGLLLLPRKSSGRYSGYGIIRLLVMGLWITVPLLLFSLVISGIYWWRSGLWLPWYLALISPVILIPLFLRGYSKLPGTSFFRLNRMREANYRFLNHVLSWESREPGHVERVRRLARRGFRADWYTLRFHLGDHNLEIVQALVESGALKMDRVYRADQSEGGHTPLHHFVHEGDVKCVEWLLGRGADPNARNRLGETPLMMLLPARNEIEKYLSVADLLLARGADPSVKETGGSTVVDHIERWSEISGESSEQDMAKELAYLAALREKLGGG